MIRKIFSAVSNFFVAWSEYRQQQIKNRKQLYYY